MIVGNIIVKGMSVNGNMNQSYYDDDYTETNRDKVLSPRRRIFWCLCDRNLISPWKKCSVCGRRNDRKRLKR